MNSGLRPLPAALPFARRCELMVRRGEAKSWDDAARKIGRKRGAKTNPQPKPIRLPYADS